MTITLNILKAEQSTEKSRTINLDFGEMLIILGANGTGKSTLMHSFFSEHRATAKKIAAHRQTWFPDNAINLTQVARREMETNIRNADSRPESRYKDQYAQQRPNASLYDLLDEENKRARNITNAVDEKNIELAKKLSEIDAPIKTINKLLRLSNLPIEISLENNERLVANKNGNSYSISELSDGERNALLVATDVLTLLPGTLILIDEPERHLHHSIVSPLLLSLFAYKPDCYFVVSTHELSLTLDYQSSQILLLRDCIFKDNKVFGWDFDLISNAKHIDDDLKKDLLGARRKILYVEGVEHSLDKPLYSLIFPNISIISKSGCREIERIVTGIRADESIHWIKAFGIVDKDHRTPQEIANLKKRGVHPLSSISVESIYYHPDIQRRILNIKMDKEQTESNINTILDDAKTSALKAIKPHVDRLARRVSENTIRQEYFQSFPKGKEITNISSIDVKIDVSNMVRSENIRLNQFLDTNDLSKIIEIYPLRETDALTQIAKKLGFPNRKSYEMAVINLLTTDDDALNFVKNMFHDLLSMIEQE